MVRYIGIWVLAPLYQALRHFKMMVIWLCIIVLEILCGAPVLPPQIQLAQEAHFSTKEQLHVARVQQIVLLALSCFHAQCVALGMALSQEGAGFVQLESIQQLVPLVLVARLELITHTLGVQQQLLVWHAQLEAIIQILGVQLLLLVSYVQPEGIIQLSEAVHVRNAQLGLTIQALEVQLCLFVSHAHLGPTVLVLAAVHVLNVQLEATIRVLEAHLRLLV